MKKIFSIIFMITFFSILTNGPPLFAAPEDYTFNFTDHPVILTENAVAVGAVNEISGLMTDDYAWFTFDFMEMETVTYGRGLSPVIKTPITAVTANSKRYFDYIDDSIVFAIDAGPYFAFLANEYSTANAAARIDDYTFMEANHFEWLTPEVVLKMMTDAEGFRPNEWKDSDLREKCGRIYSPLS